MSRPSRPLGLRREALFFLPTAVFLLIVIASFNLLVYRNAVDDIRDGRLDEARQLARRVAARLASGPTPAADRLERLVPVAEAIAVRGRGGRIVAQRSSPIGLDLTALTGESQPSQADAFGPSAVKAPIISAVAPFERQGDAYYVQIDLDAMRLASHVESLDRILLLNALVLGSLTVLVLLFLRHLLAPYDAMLEQARRIQGNESDEVDETQFLIRTFERALQALNERDDGVDDIAVLERTLASSLESGFLLLDAGGAVLSLNKLGAEVLGVDAPAQGTALEVLLAEHQELLGIVRQAVDSRTASQRREAPIGPAADRRIVGLTVHPLRRDDGAIRGFIVLFADLTRAKAEARQDQISRSLSQLGEIAAGVAHEMRNGLGTLKGYLSLIEHSGEEESVRDYLAEMRSESAHLERVLADFLSFARPGSLRSEPLDLANLLARASEDPALLDASFDLDVEETPLVLNGDPHLLDRAVRNLLQNALEAHRSIDSTEPIRIRLSRQGDTAVIEIEDAGPGLPEELRESLFQPFVSGRADGVGLGLALAHRIVELHEGSLELVNGEHRGVLARLHLPVTLDT